MGDALGVVAAVVFVVAAGGSAWFAVESMREGEYRAARRAGWAVLALVGAAAAVLAAPAPVTTAAAVAVSVAVVGGVTLAFLPIGRVDRGADVPRVRVDERDIMFARARLDPGGPEFEAYYTMRPENRESDDRTRALPGLGSLRAGKANPWAYTAMDASFFLTEAVRGEADGAVAPERATATPERFSGYVKGLARFWGARTVGVAELRPPHVYSHVGRGDGVWGAPLDVAHRFAIAFTVEMDFDLVRTGPEAAEVMESAHQYVESAAVALQLGYAIRSLGYPARAHIDGNYQVIAPLVARDAGLGELGRMGLLMTPELGPRVRLGVVTTDLPLVPDGRSDDASVLDFCRICKKCADNCPSRSIPSGDRAEVDGALRWRIDPDSCFRFWNSVGTDCGRCMSVCPYSHPDTTVHNLVRWANRHSGFARRVTLRLDDAFYGRTPEPGPGPGWLPPIS
ncbi:MAG: 4Fe-4S dicluster domain-containing protein [Thermoleophilia bacterium]